MKFFCFVFFIFCTTAKSADPDSTVADNLYLKDIDRNDILWMTLFTKINTILGKTSKLSEGQIILNKRLDAMELVLTDFMKSSQTHLMDLKERLDAHDLKSTNYMDNTPGHFTDWKKSQDDLERKLSDFTENTENQLTDLKKGQEAEEQLLRKYYNRTLEWTTILRRQDGSVDFYRNWTEYQKGFGNSDGEFFIGLNKLYALTALGATQELMVILRDFKNEERIARYDLFRIGSETEKYAIKELGTYSGDAGDSLSDHKGMKFSTNDQDNDMSSGTNCAKNYKGAWWFKECYRSHLFGPYQSETNSNLDGVSWIDWRQIHSFKFVEMKIHPHIY